MWRFPKIGVPSNHLFKRDFPYKPSILGTTIFRKPPYDLVKTIPTPSVNPQARLAAWKQERNGWEVDFNECRSMPRRFKRGLTWFNHHKTSIRYGGVA